MIYFPPLQATFQTEALSLGDLAYVTAIASTVLIFDEARKWWQRVGRPLNHRAATGMRKKKRSWDGKAYETV